MGWLDGWHDVDVFGIGLEGLQYRTRMPADGERARLLEICTGLRGGGKGGFIRRDVLALAFLEHGVERHCRSWRDGRERCLCRGAMQ